MYCLPYCLKYCFWILFSVIVYCYCLLFIVIVVYCLLFIVLWYCLLLFGIVYCFEYCLLFFVLFIVIVDSQYCCHCCSLFLLLWVGRFSDVSRSTVLLQDARSLAGPCKTGQGPDSESAAPPASHPGSPQVALVWIMINFKVLLGSTGVPTGLCQHRNFSEIQTRFSCIVSIID